MPAHAQAHARRQSWWLLAVLMPSLKAPGISALLARARGEFSALQDTDRAPAAASPSPLPRRPCKPPRPVAG